MKKTILKVIILAFFILLHKNTVYAGETTFFMGKRLIVSI